MTSIPERLSFHLPDFLRTTWVSNHARNIWEPKIKAITRAWIAIEEKSVCCNIREAALISVPPITFLEKVAEWQQKGIVAKVVAKAKIGAGYSTCLTVPKQGERFSFRVAIGQVDAISNITDAYNQHDVIRIGKELGYPECCRLFFREVWTEAKLRDSTWRMALRTPFSNVINECFIQTEGNLYSNILWRWMGIRAVPHLPCSFNCNESASNGKSMVDFGFSCGYGEEMSDLLDILSWPIEWSALHGIAEVKTPILKFIVPTDTTSGRYTVQIMGTSYPAEGAYGLGFPFQYSRLPLKNSTPSSSHGTPRHSDVPGDPVKKVIRVNGFRTREMMDNAHRPLLKGASDSLSGVQGGILDLGCGDGTLIKKISELVPHTVPYGIDVSEFDICEARKSMPDFSENFFVGNLFENSNIWKCKFQLVLLGLQRLEELASDKQINALLQQISSCSERLLIYIYSDSSKTRSFSLRAEQVGLRFSASPSEGSLVSWGFVNLDQR